MILLMKSIETLSTDILPLFYRVRDSAPDGSSPRDCALLLAMEDNLKIFLSRIYSKKFLIRSRWEYDVSVESPFDWHLWSLLDNHSESL